MTSEDLYRSGGALIVAPHFAAGVIWGNFDSVVQAAPIVRYMMGWSWKEVTDYCLKKGWRAEPLRSHNFAVEI
jgi:hypothetical protein